MKGDLISRKAAIALCDWYEHEFSECDYAVRKIAEDLRDMPPVPELDLSEYSDKLWQSAFETGKKFAVAQLEPKKGEWIKERVGYTYEDDEWIIKTYIYQVTCPCCGDELRKGTNKEVEFEMKRNKFCKNCGADMRGGQYAE